MTLNYTNTSYFFAGLLLLEVGIDLTIGISGWSYLGLYLVYSGCYFWGAFRIDSNFFMPVLCAKQTSQKVIALSFDDGPSTYTPEILDILSQHRVQAAFFCIGKHIERYPAVLTMIHQQGHLIGNHTDSHHFWFDCFTSAHMLDDIQRMDERVQFLLGYKPNLFRPPYGVTLPWLRRAVEKGRYIAIGWSVRSLDTVIKDEQRLLQKVLAGLQPGAIFLFHDTQKITLTILAEFLAQVERQGYQVVRIDKLLAIDAYRSILKS